VAALAEDLNVNEERDTSKMEVIGNLL